MSEKGYKCISCIQCYESKPRCTAGIHKIEITRESLIHMCPTSLKELDQEQSVGVTRDSRVVMATVIPSLSKEYQQK